MIKNQSDGRQAIGGSLGWAKYRAYIAFFVEEGVAGGAFRPAAPLATGARPRLRETEVRP